MNLAGSAEGAKMARWRVILISSENGQNEHVVFTEDFDTPADEWCCLGINREQVDSDTVVEVNLPLGFPTERALARE